MVLTKRTSFDDGPHQKDHFWRWSWPKIPLLTMVLTKNTSFDDGPHQKDLIWWWSSPKDLFWWWSLPKEPCDDGDVVLIIRTPWWFPRHSMIDFIVAKYYICISSVWRMARSTSQTSLMRIYRPYICSQNSRPIFRKSWSRDQSKGNKLVSTTFHRYFFRMHT